MGAATQEPLITPPDTVKANRIYKYEIIYDSAQMKAYDSLMRVYRCNGKKL